MYLASNRVNPFRRRLAHEPLERLAWEVVGWGPIRAVCDALPLLRRPAAALRSADLVVLDESFLDERGVTTALVRRYTRAAGGQRAVGCTPAGHWTQLTD